MPCFDGQSAYLVEQAKKEREKNPLHYAKEDIIKTIQQIDELHTQLETKNHLLTDMLCRLCCTMFALDYADGCALDMADKDINDWWDKHQQFDKERK